MDEEEIPFDSGEAPSPEKDVQVGNEEVFAKLDNLDKKMDKILSFMEVLKTNLDRQERKNQEYFER